jgi:hypothetical protein
MLLSLVCFLALVMPARAQTGCCSLKELTCNATYGTSYESCMSQDWDTGKMLVWYPSGIPNPLPSCIRAKRACTSHAQCCGSNVCSGLGREYKSRRQCNHPQDVCKSFNAPELAAFCESRSECRWQAATTTMNATCVPDFNYTFVDPATKPLDVPDEAGCCSDDHQGCGWYKWYMSTPAMCTASSAANVWLRDWTIGNPKCYATWHQVNCNKNSQCCGTLVCAAPASNPADVKCRPPSTVCPTFTANSTAGIALCNAAPGCKWESNKCIVSFNASMFDTDFLTKVKPTILEPTLVKSQLDGNPDRLGLCTGFVATVHGDPHFNSFDRNYYNCMGTGAFVLAKAEGMMEIQGMFYKTGAASVTRGIAIDYPALPGVPRIQISMNETADRADPTTYMINKDCAAHVFLDGILKPAQPGHSYSSMEQTYAMKFTSSGVEIQFFNGNQSSTAIQIAVFGTPTSFFGCYMNIKTCLPLNEPELRNKTVGLLGTPNGKMEDEWKISNGTVIPVSGVSHDQYSYCTSQHCVMTKQKSLFIYEGMSFKDLWSCNGEFPGDPDLSHVPPAIVNLCQGNAACTTDGALGGIQAANQTRQENNVITAIITSNKTVDAVKFEITPVRTMTDHLNSRLRAGLSNHKIMFL